MNQIQLDHKYAEVLQNLINKTKSEGDAKSDGGQTTH